MTVKWIDISCMAMADAVEELVKLFETWPSRVHCSIADFLSHGFHGDIGKLLILKSPSGSVADFESFHRPFSPKWEEEERARFRRDTHTVEIWPEKWVAVGAIVAVQP